MNLKKVVPDPLTKNWLTMLCQDELGKAWKPTYFMRTSGGLYKCFCKDPGHHCYVSVRILQEEVA